MGKSFPIWTKIKKKALIFFLHIVLMMTDKETVFRK